MSIFDTVKRSWALTKLSWHVLMQDKELLLFPILSAIGAIALFIGIVVPSVVVSALADTQTSGAFIGGFILWYVLASFVIIFFQAALIACVKKRMHGGDPTIGYGLSEAGKRILPIIGWSLISATIGLILQLLSSKAREEGGILGIVGQIVVSILGFAWTMMTLFVVPVIIIEKQGVFASMKRSTQLIRKTWGEQAVMNIGIGTAFFFIYLAIVGIGFVSVLLIQSLFLPVVIVCATLIAIAAVFQSAMNGIFNGVLYSYATGDNIPREFKDVVGTVIEKAPVPTAAK